jgi:formylglycine-generating enzyme required for sulfatase activity
MSPGEPSWVTGRWVILGDPGAGKTTLVRHLAAGLAREPAGPWVPVVEALPRLVREREWLLERIARRLRRAGRPADALPAVLEREGQEGRLLLLLDGLDEVPKEDREDAEGLLRDLSSRWPLAPLVVTSRPIGYRRPGSEFRELELLPLDEERRREFLARWFGRHSALPADRGAADAKADEALAVLKGDPSLWELAGNPLYLTLMALLLEQDVAPQGPPGKDGEAGRLPLGRNRRELYDRVFELLLEGKHRPEGKPMPAQRAVRSALDYLGFELTQDNRDSEPPQELEARLLREEADARSRPLRREPRWEASLRVFLDDLAERTGILGPHDGRDTDWRFWHRTFREALAAEELESRWRKGGEGAILAHAREIAGDESRWAEPYALLAGRVKEPDALVRALVKENRALGLRALATAQGLREETIAEVLELTTGNVEERGRVLLRLPELVGDGERALLLIDRLRRRTRAGNDLFFLDLAAREVARLFPDHGRAAEGLLGRLFDHIPKPSEALFRRVDTPLDGRVDLWRDIPAGSFWMGSPEGVGYGDERPRHRVTFTRGFQIAAVPVTNAQYVEFDPSKVPLSWKGVSADELGDHPRVDVTWYEAVAFCRWLGSSFPWARGARLATEEEWEYACRAGTETSYWSGEEEGDLERVGWFDGNSGNRTHRVGEKPANPWGLYDVHGNVWEWTASPSTRDYSGRGEGLEIDPSKIQEDLSAESRGGNRVFRGGSAWYDAGRARAAYRYRRLPWIRNVLQGFRVVLPAVPEL